MASMLPEIWKPDATCGEYRAEDRAQWLMRNQGMAYSAAVQKVIDEFPHAFQTTHPPPSALAGVWNPSLMCGNARAGDRAEWLMKERGMTRDASIAKVMGEFPSVFSSQLPSRGSHGYPTPCSGGSFSPGVMCDGATAEARVQWLLTNKGLLRQRAEEKVMQEFPRQFVLPNSHGPATRLGQPLTQCTLPHRDGASQDTWGISMLSPIRADAPPCLQVEHPVRPLHISQELMGKPVPTNKYIGNLLVGEGNQPIWTHPYIVRPKTKVPFGLSMCSATNKTFGPSNGDNRNKFYFNNVEEAFGLGASEFSSEPTREIASVDNIGVGVELRFTGGGAGGGRLTSPLVRGMAYGTYEYDGLTPVIFTKHAIVCINDQPITASLHTTQLPISDKYCVKLNNGDTWLLYSLSGDISLSWRCVGGQWELAGKEQFFGTLRCALLPPNSDAHFLDAHKHTIPIGCALETSTSGYSLIWKTRGGDESRLLHYTMLHHRVQIGSASPTNLSLPSTTKGSMVAYVGCKWQFQVQLPSIDWLPPRLPKESKLQVVRSVLRSDITNFDPGVAAIFPDNYFAGKALHKYALLILVADALGEAALKNSCLEKLKIAMEPFIAGTSQNPLKYDMTWGGIVGSRGLHGDKLADFGSSYYNDHHYHWGYFIQAAAIIARFDPAWASQQRAWVEALIRDVSNPSSDDPYFTTWRSFDWYCGHSWSQGLFESSDGKDQESTSEEINYHYGVMLWGMAVGSLQLEQLGRLMTSVATRSIQTYFLMESDNEAHPPNFIGNKVTGIFFENKADYTTWFGNNVEFIHGIQMLPITAMSEYVRTPKFVAEEWRLLEQTAHSINSGWKSVLWMNYAIVDPDAAFCQLESAPLDDGLTRTWALFWAATQAS